MSARMAGSRCIVSGVINYWQHRRIEIKAQVDWEALNHSSSVIRVKPDEALNTHALKIGWYLLSKAMFLGGLSLFIFLNKEAT